MFHRFRQAKFDNGSSSCLKKLSSILEWSKLTQNNLNPWNSLYNEINWTFFAALDILCRRSHVRNELWFRWNIVFRYRKGLIRKAALSKSRGSQRLDREIFLDRGHLQNLCYTRIWVTKLCFNLICGSSITNCWEPLSWRVTKHIYRTKTTLAWNPM